MEERRLGVPKEDLQRTATHFGVAESEVTPEMIKHMETVPRGSGFERQEAERNKELLLDILEHQVMGSGLVLNPARAMATPCRCYKIEDDGFEMCFSPGVIGSISSKRNPEQIRRYCAVGKEYIENGMARRIERLRTAIQEAHKRWEEKGGGLPGWWSEVAKSLEEHHIEP